MPPSAGTTNTGLSGDSNSLAPHRANAIRVGDTIIARPRPPTSTLCPYTTLFRSWTLSSLTITPTNDSDFTLTVSATEKDADGNLSTTTTNTEAVTVNPTATTRAHV